MALQHLEHPWPAVFDAESRVLILGTFPSPRSRAVGYPYGHSQNIFWNALAHSLGVQPLAPQANRQQRQDWLLENHVALWDVLHSCDIEGASDSSIRNPVANRFRPLVEASHIRAIFTTGRKATDLFNSLCVEEAGMRAIYLPSTSPANRARQAQPAFAELWAEVGRHVWGAER